MISVGYNASILFFENHSNVYVMLSVEISTILTAVHGDNIISNRRNDLSFANYYFIIVH